MSNANLIIAKGRLHRGENTRIFTYCSHTGLSTVGYLLLHRTDFQFIADFKVLEFSRFYDQSLLYFTFHINHSTTRLTHRETISNSPPIKFWGVLLAWFTVGQGPIVLAVGAGGGCLEIFTLIYHLFSFSLSLGDDPI